MWYVAHFLNEGTANNPCPRKKLTAVSEPAEDRHLQQANGQIVHGLDCQRVESCRFLQFFYVLFFYFELCPDFIGATCNREWAEMSRGFLRPENALLVCLDSCQLRCRWSSFGSAALKQEKLECLTSIRPQASWSVVMFSQSSGAKRSCRCP